MPIITLLTHCKTEAERRQEKLKAHCAARENSTGTRQTYPDMSVYLAVAKQHGAMQIIAKAPEYDRLKEISEKERVRQSRSGTL